MSARPSANAPQKPGLGTAHTTPTQRLGQFELIGLLGQGTHATVWLGRDERLQRQVAIKLMRATQDADALQHWQTQARQAARLSHPFIVPLFQAEMQGQQLYLVFEHVPGQTLAAHLAHQGRLAVHDAVALMEDVLSGLHAAHQTGVIHGDLKPSNIMVDEQRHARVMDFGMGAKVGGGLQLTGTPAYMAPETVAGSALSVASDIYAAGLVLLELLRGKRLRDAPHPSAMLTRIAQEPLTLPEDWPEGVDDGLRALIRRALAPAPEQRFASAADFAQALRDWAKPVISDNEASNATLDFLLRRMRHKSDFPALSDAVVRIQRVANSENDSLNDLTNEILKSVALTNKLLRLVNGANFSHISRDGISTVSRAVSLVGFNTVRTMALSLVLLDHMQNQQHAGQLREEFLRTMMAGNLAAQLYPVAAGGEQAFLGAMFQNLGRMLCAFYFPEEAAQIRQLLHAKQQTAEESAAAQVLGIGFEDLGLGVARVWGLPEALQRCIRAPHGTPPQRPLAPGAEHLRWVARAANEAASLLLTLEPAPAETALQQLAGQYTRALSLPAKHITQAINQGRQALIAMAHSLDLRAAPGSALARLLTPPGTVAAAATPEPQAQDSTLTQLNALPEQPAPVAVLLPTASPGQPPNSAQAVQVLTAGVQDITNAMVENFRLNDILRMILETMFRALAPRRMVFCLRDVKNNTLTGRFGLGDGSAEAVRALSIPLHQETDLFSAICLRGVDTLIADTTDAHMQQRLPDWYRQQLNAPTFLLLPLHIKGRPFALIYADHGQPASLQVNEQIQGLLRTLRNQAVMAFRQAGDRLR